MWRVLNILGLGRDQWIGFDGCSVETGTARSRSVWEAHLPSDLRDMALERISWGGA